MRLQDIDPGHIETHDAGRAHGGGALFRGEADDRCFSATMNVGAEFAFGALAFHGRYDFIPDHQATYVGGTGFMDEFLHQDLLF